HQLVTEGSAMRNQRISETQHGPHVQAPAWSNLGPDFVLKEDAKPPPRIEFARERILVCRLYLGLIRSISDDYGAPFAAHAASARSRALAISALPRPLMCSPANSGAIAHALKLPRATVLRRLQEMMKAGYVERVGNAYRITDKVNIPDLQERLQR